MVVRGLARLEAVGGGFVEDVGLSKASLIAMGGAGLEQPNAESTNAGDKPGGAKELRRNGIPKIKSVPNLIRGWVDDKHLATLVRCTPLIVSLGPLFTERWVFFRQRKLRRLTSVVVGIFCSSR